MVFTYKTLSKIDFEYTKHVENVSKMGSKWIKATLYTESQSENIGCITRQIASISLFLKWWAHMDVNH